MFGIGFGRRLVFLRLRETLKLGTNMSWFIV
jgi:hypothetical protein